MGVTGETDSSTKGHSNQLNVFHLRYKKRKREKADNKTISSKFNTSLLRLDVSYFVKTLKSWVTNYSLILSRNFSVYTTTSEISAI